jgi:hypothetical protein
MPPGMHTSRGRGHAQVAQPTEAAFKEIIDQMELARLGAHVLVPPRP